VLIAKSVALVKRVRALLRHALGQPVHAVQVRALVHGGELWARGGAHGEAQAVLQQALRREVLRDGAQAIGALRVLRGRLARQLHARERCGRLAARRRRLLVQQHAGVKGKRNHGRLRAHAATHGARRRVPTRRRRRRSGRAHGRGAARAARICERRRNALRRHARVCEVRLYRAACTPP
jgi:hypothetical protein